MVRIIFDKGQFFLQLILEKDFFSFELHHHIGCFDKLFSVFFGKDSEGVFSGYIFE